MRLLFFAFLLLGLTTATSAQEGSNGCLSCHNGIKSIRQPDSKMMQAILKKAKKAGYEGNDCIVCHGGTPEATTKELAHSSTPAYFKTHPGPKEFYPAPGSTWINQNTCGMCHPKQVAAQMNSLMMTEQGKIQGAMWSFGAQEGRRHDHGNYDTANPTDPHERLGTAAYKKYMQRLSKLQPQAYPKKMHEIPKAPTADEIQEDPSKAVFTYLRQECLRCHTGSKGRKARGDYRGIGCASCHVPYSNEGLYEGNDPSISKTERGHMLSHQIQSSRKVKLTIHDVTYSGVPVETCTTCHNRGKRIGVSYQGLMETEYEANYDAKGNPQPKLHTKRYLHMHEDVHYKKGMLCQDCHTSIDLHGDNFLTGANLAAVEIECQDCHGTTKKYPWELPLGYGDEFDTQEKQGRPRGVAQTLPEYLKQGFVPKNREDGYLVTARGNPFPKALKKGNKVLIHLASGKDIELRPLKLLKEQEALSKEALVAMDTITKHTSEMECYACHATWAPQCYGCHVKVDYSKGKQNPDYLAAAHDHDIHGRTGGMKDLKKYLVDGEVTESRSYLRWEDPILVQNGEGRISPAIPGCQVSITVIDKEGKTLLNNHIYKVQDNNRSVNAMDMSPVNPHTIQKEARSCESCHTSAKAMGYGIFGLANQSEATVVELMSADKRIIPKRFDEQMSAIPNLKHDWSQVIDKNGTQLVTVGHHFLLSAPLSKEQLAKLDRRGVCLSCHQSIPEGDLAVSAMTHIADMAALEVDKEQHAAILNKILKLSAWVQLLGAFLALLIIMAALKFIKKGNR